MGHAPTANAKMKKKAKIVLIILLMVTIGAASYLAGILSMHPSLRKGKTPSETDMIYVDAARDAARQMLLPEVHRGKEYSEVTVRECVQVHFNGGWASGGVSVLVDKDTVTVISAQGPVTHEN